MDFEVLKQVNGLWRKIYPFLAWQIAALYGKDSGTVLELGPFSGGISMELAKKYPGFKITIADKSAQVLNYFEEEIKNAGLSERIKVSVASLDSLDFNGSQFDLVIFRGAFFFMDKKGELVREIFRVTKEGGMAFVGGGYGKDTPGGLIHEIADESRELNHKLGRKWIGIEELKKIIDRSGLGESCRIVEEGGLWVVIDK